MIETLFTRPGMLVTDPRYSFSDHYLVTVMQIIEDFVNVGVDPMEDMAPEITETFVFSWMFCSLGGEFSWDQPFYRSFADAKFALQFAKRLDNDELVAALESVVAAAPDCEDEVHVLGTLIRADYAEGNWQDSRHGPLIEQAFTVASDVCPITVLEEDEWARRMDQLREGES